MVHFDNLDTGFLPGSYENLELIRNCNNGFNLLPGSLASTETNASTGIEGRAPIGGTLTNHNAG